MSLRVVPLILALLCVAGAASAREAALRPVASVTRDRDPGLTPARDRQKLCGAEWRGLSMADKTAKGPTWPQFYSKCVKRLKAKDGAAGQGAGKGRV